MRIIAGSRRGRRLEVPKSMAIRPTADRVRETLFNILGQFLDGEAVLDLYAGTGALALEALSRGARHAVLVDKDREAQRLCRENTKSLDLEGQVELLGESVASALAVLRGRGGTFDLVFADPPYAERASGLLLGEGGVEALLSEQGIFVFEHDKREEVPKAAGGLALQDERAFGDTRLSFFGRKAA